MDPIRELENDHRIIQRVLSALTEAATRDVPMNFYERALDFIDNFVERCHQCKEEERFYPLLEQKGIDRQAGTIRYMCDEHRTGHHHVERMRELIAAGNGPDLRRESLHYVVLLREHMDKEEHVLFPIGRGILSDDELQLLQTRFNEIDEKRQSREHYRRVAQGLATQIYSHQ